MGNNHIPPTMQDGANVAGNVLAGRFRGQDVATPGIVTASRERITDNPGELAGYQDPHE